MKDFFNIMGTYFAPYKKFIACTLLLNIFAAIMNVCSFTLLQPILNILFNVKNEHYCFIEWGTGDLKETFTNNLYYYSQLFVEQYSPATALLLFGIGLALLTLLKTASDFGAAAH